jgi:hypothetical protein
MNREYGTLSCHSVFLFEWVANSTWPSMRDLAARSSGGMVSGEYRDDLLLADYTPPSARHALSRFWPAAGRIASLRNAPVLPSPSTSSL